MKKERKASARLWTGSIIAAFIAALAVFMVMLRMEHDLLNRYEKGAILVAAATIPKGHEIGEAELGKLFVQKELDKTVIPPGALTGPDELPGCVAVYTLEEGSILTKSMFCTKNELTEGMSEPVIAGLKADDIYQTVGGIIRAGDRIHIYNVSQGEAGPVWENVAVQKVFDGAGNEIEGSDHTTAAQRINIYLDRDSVKRFYTELSSGSLRIVKICGEGE